MENHYFNEHGVYTASAPATPGSMPPINALRISPPRKDGFWPVLDESGLEWRLVEDHRGRHGRIDGQPFEIVTLGPLPQGWSDSPTTAVDERTCAEKRADDFAATADSARDLALAYYAEAEAWRLRGDKGKARRATEKHRSHLLRYLEEKEAIRGRHPDPDAAAGESQEEDGNGAFEVRYWVTPSGTYHREGCRYTSGAGKWMTRPELAKYGRKTKPCRRCASGTTEE